MVKIRERGFEKEGKIRMGDGQWSGGGGGLAEAGEEAKSTQERAKKTIQSNQSQEY
jgi:hypothetical protein